MQLCCFITSRKFGSRESPYTVMRKLLVLVCFLLRSHFLRKFWIQILKRKRWNLVGRLKRTIESVLFIAFAKFISTPSLNNLVSNFTRRRPDITVLWLRKNHPRIHWRIRRRNWGSSGYTRHTIRSIPRVEHPIGLFYVVRGCISRWHSRRRGLWQA